MGFGPPNGDRRVTNILNVAFERGAMTFALPGARGSYGIQAPTPDPFMYQELIEILYHTLWESVHVFFEHRELGYDVGASSFLYPFLGREGHDASPVIKDVAASIQMKVADDAALRAQVAEQEGPTIAHAVEAISERVKRGGKLIIFGNGGSATDANDFAIDCVAPPPGIAAVPAISLSLEPANITAVANDVGVDLIFARQLIAQADAADVAVAISTSGGSKNVIAALVEARKRGLLTVALLGYDGGEIRRCGLADVSIVVSSDYIPRIQEVQASVYHVIRVELGLLAQEV
jgi:D-sedoheptulose 7-phosphate isomerase